jgi:hypothetical protein
MYVPSTRVELVLVETACVAAAHRLVLLQYHSLVAVVQSLVHVAERALADLGAALQLLRARTKPQAHSGCARRSGVYLVLGLRVAG